MFIEQGIRTENKFWKYLVGSVLIILASGIGQIPLLVALMMQSFASGKGLPTDQNSIMQMLDSNLALFLILVSFLFAIGGIFFVVKYLHQQKMMDIITTRKKLDFQRIGFAFLIWGLLTVVSTLVEYWMHREDFVITFQPIPFMILLVIGTLMIPIQTTCEELVFRGYLMQGFANLSLNKWFPLLMTAMIFGLMHIFNPEIEKMGHVILVYYIGTGLFLGIITLMDEGMELSLGFHAANNLIGALLVTADWSAFQTASILKDVSDPSVAMDTFLPVLIIYPALLFVFGKKYHWSDWKEKLTGKISTKNIENHEHTHLS